MLRSPATAKDIFLAVLDAEPTERAARLDRACAGDTALRHQVEALLQVHDEPDKLLDRSRIALGFFDEEAAQLGSSINPLLTERPGTVIGPYKLLEQIGEGGMGVVYMAEQTQPIQCKVALKIVKPGMDTKQVLARFDAERQALALMDHPNIARVLDAGTTESGRPYFVMELVRGAPITEFCDQHKLNIRQRLELFVNVCQAVQHAHQKGIIHRDLKPTNVLVTLHDTKPVVKVIDFGVAKATGQKLTEKTLFTGLTQMIGTPLYMSPEQAELSGLDVDTRSDIYSLGVLLYELLTGHTPFDHDRLRVAAFDELRRIIREEEPPRPSTRFSTLAQQDSSTISEQRNTDPRHLSRLFQGELDWIAMKTLEKDRNRRYETASALAADVEHYLHDEPVEACPPSQIYRLRKFARRNRVALLTSSLVLAALILGTAVSVWQAIEATHAKQQAKASEQFALKNSRRADAISDFLINAFRSPDPARDGRTVTIAEVLDRAVKNVNEEFADDQRMHADLLNAIAQSYQSLGLYREAVLLFAKVQELRSGALGPDNMSTIESMSDLASACDVAGQFDKAISLYEEILKIQQAHLTADDPAVLSTTTKLAWAYNMSGQSEKALALFENVLQFEKTKLAGDKTVPVALTEADDNAEADAGKKSTHLLVENTFERLDDSGPKRKDVLVALNNLALAFAQAGQVDQAIPLYQQTLKLMQDKFGSTDPTTLVAQYNLAMAYKVAGRYGEATPLFEETLRLRREKLGPDDPVTVATMTCVGVNYAMAGNHDKCAELFGEVLRIRKAKLGDSHPETLWAMWQYGITLCDDGRDKEAVPLFEKALALSKVNPGVNHPTTLGLISTLASVYESNGRFDEAIALLDEMFRLREATLGPDNPATLSTMRELARIYGSAGRFDEAISLSKEAFRLAKTKLGPDHADTIRAMLGLANGYQIAGRLDEAEALHEELLRLRTVKLGPDDRDTIGAKNGLAYVLIRQGKFVEAETLLSEDLPTVRAKLPPDDPTLAARLTQLALALLMEGKFTEAEPMAREALELREKQNPDEWTKFNSQSLLGGILLGQKNYSEAEPLILSGYEGLHERAEKIFADRKPFLRQSLERVVQFYETTSQSAQAVLWKNKLAEFDKAQETSSFGKIHLQTTKDLGTR